MRHTFQIAWIAIRELLYERVFYILLSFAAAALALSLMLGQMTYAEQAKLTLDFMLAGIELSMILFSIFMGISLFQRELSLGSISMVLSKPVSRASFILGKYLGQLAVQLGVTLLMGLFTALVCMRFGSAVSFLSIFQTCLLIALEIAVLTAITYFFAVNAGAITTAVAALAFFAIGHLENTIADNVKYYAENDVAWKAFENLIPNLEVFNMKSLASYGLSIPWHQVGLASLYAAICVVFYLVAASICFERKDILT